MGLSNKALLAGAAGIATLALVGVGAGASFTSSASAGGTVSTGHVQLTVSTSRATYMSEGQQKDWSASPDSTGNGFSLGQLSPVGSDFTATIPMHVENTGSLPISHLTASVSDPGNNGKLAMDTELTLVYGGHNVGTASLNDIENSASSWGDLARFLPNHQLAVGKSYDFTIEVAPAGGSYGNADEDQTIAPVFTVNSSDA